MTAVWSVWDLSLSHTYKSYSCSQISTYPMLASMVILLTQCVECSNKYTPLRNSNKHNPWLINLTVSLKKKIKKNKKYSFALIFASSFFVLPSGIKDITSVLLPHRESVSQSDDDFKSLPKQMSQALEGQSTSAKYGHCKEKHPYCTCSITVW